MKNCGKSITFLPATQKEFVNAVMKRQKKIADAFLKHKDNIHKDEDPDFLDNMSDILDIRLWNLQAFDPTDKDNTHEDELFQRELPKRREKLENCVAFFDDIDTDVVKGEMLEVLRMIYDYEKETNLLSRAMNKSHIIDQSRYYNTKKAEKYFDGPTFGTRFLL